METEQKPYKFVVRLPLSLRNKIADAAKYYRRSMNSEIIARLEQSFWGLPSADDEQLRAPYMHQQLQDFFVKSMDGEEEELVRAFRRLTPEKRQALLQLLG